MATVQRPFEFSRNQLLGPSVVLLLAVVAAVLVGPQFKEYLPATNALLNSLATVLLVYGFVEIKRGRERTHTIAMLSAFGVSILFLACYLVYHWQVGSRPFTGQGAVRTVYFAILISHVILAAVVPLLAGVTIVLGVQDRRARHRKWAVVTFPIWLYVSITGVVIYLMLYQLYPAA